MTRIVATAVVAALTLGACAERRIEWYHPEKVYSDLAKDKFACETATRAVERSFGYGYDRRQEAFGYFVRCMGTYGWRLL